MKELLVSIAAGLVEAPDQVTVTEDAVNEEGVIVFHLHVAEDDMGRVIGKQGRIAKAIRTVMRAAANRTGNLPCILAIDSSGLIPSTDSVGPLIPTSLIYPVPFSSILSSFVSTWVWVPKSADTLPSR